jgi:hypothetical protein
MTGSPPQPDETSTADPSGWRLSLIEGPSPARRRFELTDTAQTLPFTSSDTLRQDRLTTTNGNRPSDRILAPNRPWNDGRMTAALCRGSSSASSREPKPQRDTRLPHAGEHGRGAGCP